MIEVFQNLATSLLKRLKGDGLEARVLRDTGSSFVLKTGGMGISFLLQLVLARILGVEEFGYYIYAVTWMMTLSMFGNLGFGLAAIRYVADYKALDEWDLLHGYIQRSTQLVFALSTLSVIILVFVIWLLSALGIIEQEIASIFWYASPLLLLFALFDLQTGILRGVDRLASALTLKLVLYPLGVGIGVIFNRLLMPSPVGALVALAINIFMLVLVIALQKYYIRRALPDDSLKINSRYRTREWLDTSISMWASQAIRDLLRRLDVLVVGTFIGTSEAGIYSITTRLVQIIDLGLQATNLASAHRFAPLHSQGKKEELQRIVFLTTKMSILSTFPIALILFIGAEKVMLLFGKDFVGGMPVLKILIFGEMVNVLTGPNALLMNMTGHHKEMLRISFFTLILDISLMLILFNRWGVLGIATASALSIMFRNLITVLLVWQHLGVNSTIFTLKAWGTNKS